jgi:hypothetical protein
MGVRDSLSVPQVLLVALVVAGLLTLAAVGSTSSEAFGTFNNAWDGASGVRSAAAETGATVEVATETTQYDDAGSGTVAVVLGPTEPYTDADYARMEAFLARGGTLIVAEDIGAGGNRVLDGVGAETRFDGRLVIDQRHHGPTVEMPLATNVSDAPATRGVDEVMLNHGTVLTNTTNATVLVRTSAFAAVDENSNGVVDETEPLQSYPVVAAEPVAGGTVIAVSDPSVFINTMQSRASNAALTRGLFGGADRVLLDYSRAGEQPPIRAALLWLQRTPLAVAALGALGLALVARATRADSITSVFVTNGSDRTYLDEDTLRTYLLRKNPDWDASRVSKLITGTISPDDDSESDE